MNVRAHGISQGKHWNIAESKQYNSIAVFILVSHNILQPSACTLKHYNINQAPFDLNLTMFGLSYHVKIKIQSRVLKPTHGESPQFHLLNPCNTLCATYFKQFVTTVRTEGLKNVLRELPYFRHKIQTICFL